eukprot:403359352
MELFQDEIDDVQLGSASRLQEMTDPNLDYTPNELKENSDKKLDPSLMKALKLFAKNHQQLEKAQDPQKGQHHRRILSQDGRTANLNIPAYTHERNGQPIPKGPKFYNKLVEKELEIYKKEVEEKFKNSYMNNTYQFPRKQQQQYCRTGPDRSVERETNNQTQNMPRIMNALNNNNQISNESSIQPIFNLNALKHRQIGQQKPQDNINNQHQMKLQQQQHDLNSKTFDRTVTNQQSKSFINSPKLNSSFNKQNSYNNQVNEIQSIKAQNGLKNQFVNNNGAKLQAVLDEKKFSKSAAQRSPRNSSQQNQHEESFVTNNNQIIFPQNLVKKYARSKPQRVNTNQVVNGSKNQNFNNPQIMTTHNPQLHQTFHQPQSIGQQQNNLNPMRGLPKQISRTQDQRQPLHTKHNEQNTPGASMNISNIDYLNMSHMQNMDDDQMLMMMGQGGAGIGIGNSLNMSFQVNSLNHSFAMPNQTSTTANSKNYSLNQQQYIPKISNAKKIILRNIGQKSTRVNSQLKKQTPLNISNHYQQIAQNNLFVDVGYNQSSNQNRNYVQLNTGTQVRNTPHQTNRSNSKSNIGYQQRSIMQKLTSATNTAVIIKRRANIILGLAATQFQVKEPTLTMV